MTITISADDPRTVKAISIAASAGQWLRCRARDGQKAFGVPSGRTPSRYYLVTTSACDCEDFRRHGLSGGRIGQSGSHQPCKHMLAVRLYVELVKAEQQKPAATSRGHLHVV